MSDFVHLHCHTEYSLLDGAVRIKDLVTTSAEWGLPACAITDHGNMHGAVNFYMMAKDAGIKPIIGCEVYVAGPEGAEHHGPDSKRFHLLLLAQNTNGYRNLMKLVSDAHLKGFYYKPRVDKKWLQAHGEGLIACSACLAGEVPRTLMNKGLDAGIAMAREYATLFPDRFYLELQANGLEEQARCNQLLLECHEATGLPLVATNDCHYLRPDDVEAHDVLLCIQTAAQVADAKRMRFETDSLYYRSPEEMAKEFGHLPQALANTCEIAERIDLDIDLKSLHFPVYDLPEGMTLETEFRRLSKEGLQERLDKLPYRDEINEQDYWDRLDYELDIICKMEFPGYFLIVQDFINWAKDNKIPVGPGRGSAAGSLVAWALKITNLDPLPYNLLFERFLNVERISMPDIDVDFCERRRQEVIQYVADKYGADKVAQITTFGTMKAKAAVKDVGRALGMTFAETNAIAKLIPDEMKMTIAKAMDVEPELKRLAGDDPQVAKCLDISLRLEGLSRHCSTHAAGVVISPGPMDEFVPIYRDKKGGVVTQYDMKKVEKVGLIKFDFLGLRTMTVIQDTLDLIEGQGMTPPDLDTITLEDKATYKLYCRGDTDGIFQVESQGMRKYLQMLKPSTFEDIIAMLALYRPGPLGSGMVDEFIKRKHGEVAVSYPHPSLEETLKPTYGVIVYHEQVMAIAMIMGGFSLGQGDLLRRAMGKKIAEAMAEQKVRFLDGAKEKGIDQKIATEVFDLMEKFAAYGFNKSHSAAYALISYYTAYLKTHYPKEFMAALMTSELENQDKLLKYIGSCRDMRIPVTPPDINKSFTTFTVADGAVVYGLGAVKNVGEEAVGEIIAEREENGPFSSLFDLCTRVNLRKITKRVLESLIKAGAFDSLGITRNALLAGMEKVVSMAQKRQKEKDSGQLSMLGLMGCDSTSCLPGLGIQCEEQNLPEWPDSDKLKYEKEAIGFYLSSHPLMAFRHELKRQGLATLEHLAETPEGAQVRTALLITSVKEHLTKKGDKMAFCTAEDVTGSAEVVLFPDAYADAKAHIEADEPLVVTARVGESSSPANNGGDSGDDEPKAKQVKLVAETVKPLADMVGKGDQPLEIALEPKDATPERLQKLDDILNLYPGTAQVFLELALPEARCRFRLRRTVCPSLDLDREVDLWKEA